MLSRFLPRLRTVLVLVNLSVMAMPLGSIFFLRLYENEIIRQKELALLSQAAYVAAIFRGELIKELDLQAESSWNEYYGHLINKSWLNPINPSLPYSPLGASLNLLKDLTRDPLPVPSRQEFAADGSALSAGARVTSYLFRAQTLTQDEVGVVDYSGTLVASTFGTINRSLAGWEEIQRALQGEHVSLMRLRFKAPKRDFFSRIFGFREATNLTVAMPVTNDVRVIGAVVLIGRPSNLGDVLYGYRGQLTFALTLLVLVVLVLAIITSLTITEPIDVIVRESKAILGGDFKAVKPMRFPLVMEIKLLHEAIANMASNLSKKIEYIGGFARSVSHEFKTPLTAIRGSVELLKDHHESMSPVQRDKFLSHIESSVERLQLLVERLLQLAEADQSTKNQAISDVREVLSEYNAGVEADRQVQVDGPEGRFSVPMEREVLGVVLQNLIENGFLHGGADTSVTIRLRRDDRQISVQVADTGGGITPGNQKQIFEAFFTTRREDGGTGLGLNIVRSFVEACGGRLELIHSDNAGTSFEMTFPLRNK